MATACVAEQNQDSGRAANRGWDRRRCLGRTSVRRLGDYFRRAAARRAIHRMLYWASK